MAGRNGGWIRRILDHHVENPPETLAIWLGAGGGRETLAFRFGLAHFLNGYSFLMISPNLLDIWAMFFLILSRCETLHFFYSNWDLRWWLFSVGQQKIASAAQIWFKYGEWHPPYQCQDLWYCGGKVQHQGMGLTFSTTESKPLI